MMMMIALLIYFFSWVVVIVHSQNNNLILQIQVSPSGCRGGEIFDIQPSILIINKDTQQIVYGFLGAVYVQLGSSPTGYESLYVGDSNTVAGCDLEGCGQKVVGTIAQVSFINGVATFQVSNIRLC
jgi:hypothetical protein